MNLDFNRVTYPIPNFSFSFDLWTLEIIPRSFWRRVLSACEISSHRIPPCWWRRRYYYFFKTFFSFFFLGIWIWKNVTVPRFMRILSFNLWLCGVRWVHDENVDAWQSNKQKSYRSSMLVGSRAIYPTELKNPAGYRLKYLLLTLLSTFFVIVGFIGYSLGESYSSISILPLSCSIFSFWHFPVRPHPPPLEAISYYSMATVPLMFFGNESSWFCIATSVCSLRPRPTRDYAGTQKRRPKTNAPPFSLPLENA